LNRTTRSVTLTEVGAGYYQFCSDILNRAEEVDAYAESLNSEPRGTLRITAAVDAGPTIMKSLINPFLEQYHQIKVDLYLTNRKVDLIKERFDLAIRAGVMQQDDSSYIARQIAQSNTGLFASPDFIKRWGKLKSIDDFDQFLMIGFASEEGFENKVGLKAKLGKRMIQLTPKYRLKVNDMTTHAEAALLGIGIAMLPSIFIQKHIDNKSLIPLLPELEFPKVGFYALYPSRHLKSFKLKVFLEYLQTWDPMF
jgi:DNA-binding transcriptional LysR family regulator